MFLTFSTMTSQKRYEILESLPVYGPMHISISRNGKPYYSAGHGVRFNKDDGTTWVGNFEPGWGKLNFDSTLSNQNILLAIEGACYIINPEITIPVMVWGDCFDYVIESDGRFIFYGNYEITVLYSDESLETLYNSFDGIKDVVMEGNILKGFTNDYTDMWAPFEYNLNTKELKAMGGNWTYDPENKTVQIPKTVKPPKKSWWKF